MIVYQKKKKTENFVIGSSHVCHIVKWENAARPTENCADVKYKAANCKKVITL